MMKFQCGAFPYFWLSAVTQPWTTSSSCEPTDCKGESSQWCKFLLATEHGSTQQYLNRGIYNPPPHTRVLKNSASPLSRLTPASRSWSSATCRGIQPRSSSHCWLVEILQPTSPLPAAAPRLCSTTSARWKACRCGSRSLSPWVWIQQP